MSTSERTSEQYIDGSQNYSEEVSAMQIQNKSEDEIAYSEKRFSFTLAYALGKLASQKHRFILLCILAFSALLRFYHFPQFPNGINQDEVSAGYEAYSLLTHGTDRWGNPFPIYFPSWGSGQNVLQSYLSIPFIKIFGLNIFAERLLPTLLSILTIFVLYKVVQKIFDIRTALVAAFLLSMIPWHVMMSRWSLESNLLPFFMLLGITTLIYCYESKCRKWLIPFSLSFLAIAFYAYGISIFVIPSIIILYIFLKHKSILQYKFGFILSLCVFLVIALPFFLFILDNDILHSTPEFIKHLPFTVPLLISGRLTQLSDNQTLLTNIRFAMSNFNDGLIWNTMPWYAPLGILTIPLACVGIYSSVRKRQVHAMIFVLWLVSALPLFAIVPLNINRINTIFIPLIALSAIGLIGLYDLINIKSIKIIVITLLLVIITVYNSMFCYGYFKQYNGLVQSSFNAGFDTALAKATNADSSGEIIYVSDRINLNYMYVLFFLKIDPQDFQHHSHIITVGDQYQVDNYRNYYFLHTDPQLIRVSSYIAILKGDEQLSCSSTQLLYSAPGWTVERCFNN